MIVTYQARDGRVVLESEALDEAGGLRDGFSRHVRVPVTLRDGVPTKTGPVVDAAVLALFDEAERGEIAVVLDAFRSEDHDRTDWARLECNRIASRERSRGNPRAAMALEQARDDAAARLRNRVPAKGSSEEARAAMVGHLNHAWRNQT
jgi:hypothetical protein